MINSKEVVKINILNITQEVYEDYKIDTNGNENITFEQARKKLTRNVLLAMKVPPENDHHRERGTELFVYGNLWIVCKGDTVVHISNGKFYKKYPGWEMDIEKYNELTKELGIAN